MSESVELRVFNTSNPDDRLEMQRLHAEREPERLAAERASRPRATSEVVGTPSSEWTGLANIKGLLDRADIHKALATGQAYLFWMWNGFGRPTGPAGDPYGLDIADDEVVVVIVTLRREGVVFALARIQIDYAESHTGKAMFISESTARRMLEEPENFPNMIRAVGTQRLIHVDWNGWGVGSWRRYEALRDAVKGMPANALAA